MRKELFTPGEWMVDRNDDNNDLVIRNKKMGYIIANLDCDKWVSDEQTEANANLFAASKNMYFALQKCKFQLQTYAESNAWNMEDEKAYELAKAALKKANPKLKLITEITIPPITTAEYIKSKMKSTIR